MGELVYMEEWDLQAIVRGCSGAGTAFSGENSFGFSPINVSQETGLFFEPEMAELDELGELYKPFYPFSTQTIVTSPVSVPEGLKSFKDKPKQQEHNRLLSNGSGTDRNPESKVKKSKKNQQKRVVQQVKEESLSSDLWAWRKYGQKPIKGSPYPRSYYRCSSSKGCLARKQVERNPLNPEIFIVTYTNEHSHGLPTRRNSLAGSTRTKTLLTKNKNQKATSPTSDPVITPDDELSGAIQEKRIAEVNSGQTAGEFEDTGNVLSPDLLSETEIFRGFAGNIDELLKNEEFDFDGCFLNY